MAAAQVDFEFLLGASVKIPEVTFLAKAATDAVAPCVVTDLNVENPEDNDNGGGVTIEETTNLNASLKVLVFGLDEGQGGSPNIPMDKVVSPIKEASGWASAPEGAKEFTMMFSGGLLRRPCLILKNEAGIYDSIAIYKSKKESEPIAVIKNGEFKREVIDEAIKNDVKHRVNRNMKVLNIAEDGTEIKMWVSAGMDTEMDTVWHPKSLFKTVTENVGYPTPTTMIGLQDRELINVIMLENWYSSADWQAAALNYLIENEGFEAIFSHFHSVDLQSHMIVGYMSDKGLNKLPPEVFQKFMEDVYIQADYYVGKFLHLLDEGWTILLFSDHAQVCPAHGHRLIGDIVGINVRVMQELGLTALKKDENGKELREIDWENTYAVAQRANHYLP